MGYFAGGRGKGDTQKGGCITQLISVLNRPAHDDGKTFDIDMLESSVQGVSSYVWDAKGIRIPGLPMAYACPAGPLGQLAHDDEDLIAYEDHLRFSSDPLAPSFLAVRVMQPDFEICAVKAVMNSNDIRKLIGYLRGDCSATSSVSADGSRDSSFRMCIDPLCAEGGIRCTRVERQDVVAANIRCFGQHFIKTVARNVGGDRGHYRRIMKVRLGKHLLLVNAEVDACKFEIEEPLQCEENGTWQRQAGHEDKLQYILQGAVIPPSHGTFVEIKTKNAKYFRDVDWCSVYLQMVFSGSQLLCLGLHKKGNFKAPLEFSLEQVRARVDRRKLECVLCHLELLIEQLVTLVQCNGSLDLFCDGHERSPLLVKKRS